VEKRTRPHIDEELGESISQQVRLSIFRHLRLF
jgi:hypothetical protein